MPYTTIKKPDDYFNTKLYTGNGSTQSITGVGFQPDFTWLKVRNTTGGHGLFDVVRGANKRLISNETSAESTMTDGLTSFDSDGFSVGADGNTNGSSETYVSWNWLTDNTSGSSNTDGSITSTVSANTTSGFSIVSYTGTGSNATVGHGLGTSNIGAIIVKNRDSGTDNWWVFHKSIGATGGLKLNATDATITASSLWNDTAPTSSVFSIGTGSGLNASGQNLIAYCFAEKQGFSKFGSYVGNGNANGTFIYTGFKPSFVLLKNTTGDNWTMLDNKRNTYNPESARLLANQNLAEASSETLDFLSNGFKCRRTDAGENGSGITYIYMAFAEEPLVGDNPATAR